MSCTHIHLPLLQLEMVIGVYPHERLERQSIDLELTLRLALCPATRTDLLTDTLDYDQVIERARALAAVQRPQLLEHFAGLLADDLLLRFAALESVRIRLVKTLRQEPPLKVEIHHERTRGESD